MANEKSPTRYETQKVAKFCGNQTWEQRQGEGIIYLCRLTCAPCNYFPETAPQCKDLADLRGKLGQLEVVEAASSPSSP